VLKQDEVYKLSEQVYENIQNQIKAHGVTLEKYNELQKIAAEKEKSKNGAVKGSSKPKETKKKETKKKETKKQK